MKRILFSWIGKTDFKRFDEGIRPKEAPLARALFERSFDIVHLASNYTSEETDAYLGWLRSEIRADITYDHVRLDSPTDYVQIYQFVAPKLRELTADNPDSHLSVHLSPGTPQMAAVSILLGKTSFDAHFLESSEEQGLKDIVIPFDISAEFLLKKSTQRLFDLASAAASRSADFDAIIGESPQIISAINDAAQFAQYNIPVLVLGETGTGKELIANAIWNSGHAKYRAKYKSINCGAIAGDLINSELFGHRKGAFTGAISNKNGIFSEADGGTIFLDEFGELPLETQVRLLRVLQEKKFTPVGATEEIDVDVRIIAATNRNLTKDITEGRFREDLFHRVAVGIVHLPSLRERQGDLKILANFFMSRIGKTLGFSGKKLTPDAWNLILGHDWPGNVRELENALTRACVLSQDDKISSDIMKRSIIQLPKKSNFSLPDELGDAFNLDRTIANIEKKYIELAMQETRYKKTKAAKLLGMKNHQNLTSKLKKYGLE